MTTQREVTVRIGLDVGGFKNDVNQVQSTLKSSTTNFARLGRQLSLRLTAPILAAGASLTLLSKRLSNTSISLIGLSEATGVSTDKIQTLQQLALRAGASGDALSASLVSLVGAMHEMRLGGAGVTKAFHILGVEAFTADGKLRDVEEVLIQVIAALAKTQDKGLLLEAGTEIFGGAFHEIAPLIAKIRKGIEDSTDEIDVSNLSMEKLVDLLGEAGADEGMDLTEDELTIESLHAKLSEIKDEFSTLGDNVDLTELQKALKLIEITVDIPALNEEFSHLGEDVDLAGVDKQVAALEKFLTSLGIDLDVPGVEIDIDTLKAKFDEWGIDLGTEEELENVRVIINELTAFLQGSGLESSIRDKIISPDGKKLGTDTDEADAIAGFVAPAAEEDDGSNFGIIGNFGAEEDALRGMISVVDDFGASLSEEQIAKLVEYHQSVVDVQLAFVGLGLAVSEATSGAMTEFNNFLVQNVVPTLNSSLIPALDKVSQSYENLPGPVKTGMNIFGLFVGILGPIIAVLGGIATQIFFIGQSATMLAPALGALKGAFAFLGGSLAIFGTILGAGIVLIVATISIIVALVFNIGGFRDSVTSLLATMQAWVVKIANVQDSTSLLGNIIIAFMGVIHTLISTVLSAGDTIGKLWGWIQDGGGVLRNTSDLFRTLLGLVNDVIEKIKDFGGGAVMGAIDAIGGVLGGIPGFAKGGISKGGFAIVGEEGPELLNLPSGASITPMSNSMGADMNAMEPTVVKQFINNGSIYTWDDFEDRVRQIFRDGGTLGSFYGLSEV